MNEPIIHLWSGQIFHDDGYIIANKEGLEYLRDYINDVLEHGTHERNDDVFTSDGEGYTLHIQKVDDGKDEAGIVYLAAPYTDDYAIERREYAIYPWDSDIEKETKMKAIKKMIEKYKQKCGC